MAMTVKPYYDYKSASASEEDGVFRSFRIALIAEEVPDTGSLGQRIQAVLNHASVPQPRQESTTIPGIYVMRREARMLTRTTVVVEVEYGAFDVGDWRVVRGGATLQGIQTERDRFGNLITVEHQGHVVCEPVDVLMPEGTLQVAGIRQIADPVLMQDMWMGTVNAWPWMHGPSGEWIVADFQFESHSVQTYPSEWRITLEFQRKRFGWQPQVYYRDEFGRIPPGLVPGVGFKTVPWYAELDYGFWLGG